MTENTYTISKKPLIASIVLTSINAIAAVFYFIFGVESLKLIYGTDNGLEALAIIVFLVYVIILGIIILVLGIIASCLALRYNSTTGGNATAKILFIVNLVLVGLAILMFASMFMKNLI